MSKKILSGNFIAGCATFLFFTSTFVQTFGKQTDMLLLPRIISFTGMVAGAGIAIMSLIGKQKQASDESSSRTTCLVLAVTAGIIIAMLLAESMGFFIMLFTLCFGLYVLIKIFCGETGVLHIAKAAVGSLLIIGSLYVVFRLLLRIMTPMGIWV